MLHSHVTAPRVQPVEHGRQLAALVVGRHDFRAFASPLEDREASTLREVERFTVEQRGSLLSFEVAANAFLPHQVRRMVGALVEVGKGKITPAAYGALLDAPAASAGPAAPAHGLYLVNVDYGEPLFAVTFIRGDEG